MSSADFGLLDPLGQGSTSGEIVGDAAWLQVLVDVEVALVRALVHAGLVPVSMETVADGLAHAGDLDADAIAAAGRGGGNPVIPLVKQLGARAESIQPGSSDWVHVGATSQDILDSAAMVIARRAIREIGVPLRSLSVQLSTLADLHRGTSMAG
ncbi:MAG TPA: 3-carboxy-cis,cis-muconate cycloisomerase, partial [Galbitalea sp.]